MSQQVLAPLLSLAGLLVLAQVEAGAQVTVYADRAAFMAAAGAARQIDFSTTDSGAPITNYPAEWGDKYFAYLGLSGVCFQNVRSYWNSSVYMYPNAVITAGLPQNTFAAGVDWTPWYSDGNVFLVTVSSGGVISNFSQSSPAWQPRFFGVISDRPIAWISFSLDSAYFFLDNFTLNASAGTGRGCPAPADDTGPVVLGVTLTPNPSAVNAPISIGAVVDDSATGSSNIAAAEYSVASGSYTPMSGAFNVSPVASVAASIPGVAAAGVYNVCVRGADTAGNVGQPECGPLPVFDPSGGFVTGGGWIFSPPSAYVREASLSGKATFGFVSKYQPGANVPAGNTQFVFHAAQLNFRSASYDWLVVAGARAQFKGAGSINGQPGFSFLLTAVDGDLLGGGVPDKFRLKIWDAAGLVYDNQLSAPDDSEPTTALAGGAITIQKK